MKKNFKTKIQHINFFVILIFIISLFICKLAYATSQDDFYWQCVESNDALDLNFSNELSDVFLSDGTDNSYEKYIKNYIDEEYCGNNKFCAATLIILKQTLVDSSLFPKKASLNDLHYGSYADAEIAMYDEYCVLYDVDEYSNYYVGYVNTIEGEVQDLVFAKTNYNGEVLDDCIYDNETGLIYVPKTYTKNRGLDNKESVLEVQMQMLVSVKVDNKKVSTSLSVSVEEDSKVIESVKLNVNALDTFIAIPAYNVNVNKTSIIVNDNIDLTEKAYIDNGYIYVNESPANIVNIKVKTSKNNLLEGLFSSSEENRLHTSLDDIPCLPYTLNKDLPATSGGYFNYVGAKYNAIMTVHYDETPSPAPYQDCLYGVNGFATDESMQTFANCVWSDVGNVDLSNLQVVSNRIYNLFTFWPESVIKEWTDGLALKCGHIGTPAAHDGDNKEVRTKILAINEQRQYALLAFVTATAGFTGQGACGIYKVKYESKGGCQMTKASNIDWSVTNHNYSLEGAQYDVYNDFLCTSYTGVSIVLDKNGKGHTATNALESKKTYYVRENPNATGVHYLYNDTVGSVYIEQANSYENFVNWNTGALTYDTPAYNTAPIKIVKSDAQTGEPGITEGDVPSFENAHYDYEYYTDYFKLNSEIEAHKSSYQRHWIMATDKKGMTCVSEQYRNYKVDGDDFYENEDEVIACPLGTYVVHEVKAPDGYLLSEKTYIMQVVYDSSLSCGAITLIYDADTGLLLDYLIDPHTGEKAAKVFEQVKRGDYKFVKTDDDARVLSGIPFKITSITTGEWHIVVSDSNGSIDTSSQHILHSNNTNINDSLYDPVLGKISDETSLVSDSGCWFAFNKKTSEVAEPQNDVGALPYDTYTVEELLISKNEMFYPFDKRSFVITNHSYNVDGGTWVNSKSTCVTNARGSSGSQKINASLNEEVVDRVYYGGLLNNQQYEIKAWLVESLSGDAVLLQSTQGNEYYKYHSFIANDSIGYVDVGATIDSRSYVGKTLVWFVEIYSSNYERLIIDHKDIIDEEESLWVVGPTFETDLLEKNTDSKIISKRTDEVLVDTIIYNNLKPGLEYTFVGTLYDKGDKNPLIDAQSGEPVTTKYSLNSNIENGCIDIFYEFDSSILKDNAELVSCVQLFNNEVCLCENTSLDNERETVIVTEPYFKTNVLSQNNDKNIISDKKTNVVDTIKYFNFAEDKEISVYSWFVHSDTGVPVTDGSISADEALIKISELLNILGGRLTMTNNNTTDSQDFKEQWLMLFFQSPNKVNLDKLKDFDWNNINHIMFSKHKYSPTKKDGVEEINFEFDTSMCDIGNIVAYTIIMLDDTVLLANTDINDKDETLTVTKNVPVELLPSIMAKTFDNIYPIYLAVFVLIILLSVVLLCVSYVRNLIFNFWKGNFMYLFNSHNSKEALKSFNNYFSDI